MVNWSKAQSQFKNLVSKNGVWIQILTRSYDLTDAYDTGSSEKFLYSYSDLDFGYGDPRTSWTTGSVKAIVAGVNEGEVITDAGFFTNDYKDIYFSPDTTLNVHDQVLCPSGSGTRYIVLTVSDFYLGDVTATKFARIRLLLPRSGSSY